MLPCLDGGGAEAGGGGAGLGALAELEDQPLEKWSWGGHTGLQVAGFHAPGGF